MVEYKIYIGDDKQDYNKESSLFIKNNYVKLMFDDGTEDKFYINNYKILQSKRIEITVLMEKTIYLNIYNRINDWYDLDISEIFIDGIENTNWVNW